MGATAWSESFSCRHSFTGLDNVRLHSARATERAGEERKTKKNGQGESLHVAHDLPLKYQVCGMLSALCIKCVALGRSWRRMFDMDIEEA